MSCRRHLLSYISKSQIPQPLIVCVPFPGVCVFALRNEMLRGSCRKIILRKTIPFGASRSSTKRDLRSLCTWSYLDDSAHSLMCFENICYKRRVCNCTFFFSCCVQFYHPMVMSSHRSICIYRHEERAWGTLTQE